MSCTAQFPPKFEFTCLFALIGRLREVPNSGVSMSLLQDTLWLSGTLISSFDPVGVTLDQTGILSELEYEDLVTKLEGAFKDEEGEVTEASIQVLRDDPKSKNWSIYIPIILEIIKFLIDKRKQPKMVDSTVLDTDKSGHSSHVPSVVKPTITPRVS